MVEKDYFSKNMTMSFGYNEEGMVVSIIGNYYPTLLHKYDRNVYLVYDGGIINVLNGVGKGIEISSDIIHPTVVDKVNWFAGLLYKMLYASVLR